jgi:hypothetical protein
VSEFIDVTLTDHLGTSPKGNPVDHGQWIVMADGVHVGYISKQPGSWFASIVAMDEATKTQVVAAIEEKISARVEGVVMPVDPDDEPQEEQDE